MTRTVTVQDNGPDRPLRRTTWWVRALVLGALTLATVYTAAALVLGAGTEHIGSLWMAAIAWTVAASLAGALWRGFRHGDWSAFHAYELPRDDDDLHEWIFRTGRYSSLREMEDALLHDDRHLR
ncbi:MAG: hypothetical protein OXK20_05150 [Deltaproteobacteria bacterium]|nr:hypothetical protein [Deltaproteobacteria bacterium]